MQGTIIIQRITIVEFNNKSIKEEAKNEYKEKLYMRINLLYL